SLRCVALARSALARSSASETVVAVKRRLNSLTSTLRRVQFASSHARASARNAAVSASSSSLSGFGGATVTTREPLLLLVDRVERRPHDPHREVLRRAAVRLAECHVRAVDLVLPCLAAYLQRGLGEAQHPRRADR